MVADTTLTGGPGSPEASLEGDLSRNWWAIFLRGALGVLFGVIAIGLPGATMLSLVFLFAAYMLVDGVLAIVASVRAARRHNRWGILAIEGVVDILAGVIAFAWPGLTLVVFVLLVGAWATLSGALMLAAAFRLPSDHGRWWLAVGGIASLVYGILLFVAPMIGALVLTWWIGAYAMVFGVALIMLSLRLRSRLAERPGAAAR
jgi:uncharacterized membrane protein HdeD (DUF308 family)